MMAVLKHWHCMTEQHQVITICSSHVTISPLSARHVQHYIRTSYDTADRSTGPAPARTGLNPAPAPASPAPGPSATSVSGRCWPGAGLASRRRRLARCCLWMLMRPSTRLEPRTLAADT